MILEVKNLSHGFGDRAIFENVSFRLLKGEHIGLIGANGEGKSTFMNIITGHLMPDEGTVEWTKNVRVGYLDQHAVLEKGMTIRDVLKSAFAFLFDMEADMNRMFEQMGEASPEEMEKLLEETGTIQELLEHHDFYMIDAKVEEIGRALGLMDIGLDRDVTELSGGQRTKVLMGKLLLEKPDILLLDEPTNYLDEQHIEWLKRYLNDYFTGKIAGSISRGELYNDDPVTQDARFCGTTASMCGIEKAGFEQNKEAMETAVREDLMLHAYMLTQSGIPMLYSGDELGQVNDYSYKEDPAKCADSRYIHRGKLQWELAENKNDPTTVQGSIFQTLDRLEKIRGQEITFDKDADVYTYDVHDDSVLCILREYKGRRFFGIFNFSDQEKTAWMQEDGVYRNLLTSEKMELKDIRLRGYDFLWCEK